MFMSDKERLEEIKKEVESLRGDMSVTSIETETSADIILDDMEWLIEQAQRVQELEEENIGLKQDLKDVSDKLEAVSDV